MNAPTTTADNIPLAPEIAAELRAIGSEITLARETLVKFDVETNGHKQQLEDLRREIKTLEVPSTLPDDGTIQRLVFSRAKAELLANFFQNSLPARRAMLIHNLKTAMVKLSTRLRELTGRTHPRYFENPNLANNRPDIAANCAVVEIERVVGGVLDDFEKLQPQRPLIFT